MEEKVHAFTLIDHLRAGGEISFFLIEKMYTIKTQTFPYLSALSIMVVCR